MTKVDFAPLDEAMDGDDYEFMNTYAPHLLTIIERLLSQGATVEDIKGRIQRRVSVGREAFVKRCEGAARYIVSRRVG